MSSMSGTSTVLVVNNDAETRACLAALLQCEGFCCLEVGCDESALQFAHDHQPDVILIDLVMKPGKVNGLELCRRLRTFTTIPIVFLTTHVDEIDHLLGLAVGADDYLAKPFSPRLLAARLSTVLRRTQGTVGASHNENALLRDDVHIDKETRTVTVKSVPVQLTRTEFDLLVALAEKPKRVFTRNQLIETVWGDWYGNDSHLDVHMSRLRKKILDAGGPRVGHAVRGFGFRYTL